MDSLLRVSVVCFCIFIFAAASGSDPWRIPAGAAEAGMGYSCLTRSSLWSSFHNQANLAYYRKISAGISYENRFGINELSTKTAGAVVPAGNASLGAVYSYFGYSDFKRHTAGLGCGLKLSDKLAAGAQVDYFSEKIYGDYKDHRSVTFEVGILLSPADNISVGVHLFNPLPESLTGSLVPSVIRAGAGVNLDTSVFVAAEAEMSTVNGFLVRTGFEYEAFKKLLVRGGFCNENTAFSFGLGYRLDFVQLDLGFVTHDRLGVTSSASMIFFIK